MVLFRILDKKYDVDLILFKGFWLMKLGELNVSYLEFVYYLLLNEINLRGFCDLLKFKWNVDICIFKLLSKMYYYKYVNLS